MQLLPRALRTLSPSLDLHAYRTEPQEESAAALNAVARREPESPGQSQRAGERERYRVLYRSQALRVIVTLGKRVLASDSLATRPERDALLALVSQTLNELRSRSPVLFTPEIEGLLHSSENALDNLKDNLVNIGYDFYADMDERDRINLSTEEQEAMLTELDQLSSEGICRIAAQRAPAGQVDRIHGMSPGDALRADYQDALDAHFYIFPGAQGKKPHHRAGDIARISLSLAPKQVAAVSRRLVEMVGENTDWIYEMKIMAPSEQGKRRDSIVLYLSWPDVKQAKQLANALQRELEPRGAFRPLAPPGMHAFHPGISYGEISSYSRQSSFGYDRCSVVADVVINLLLSDRPADELLDAILPRYGYSTENPALIDRAIAPAHAEDAEQSAQGNAGRS